MSLRSSWRRTAMGAATILGLARRGWFIPYRYAATLAQPGENPPYPALEALFAGLGDRLLAPLDELGEFAGELRAIDAAAPAGAPRWLQGWFPTLDAAIAYGMVRKRRPKLIVEVGSGHSTRFLARAVADGGMPCHIEAIDPAPRAAISSLAPRVALRRQTVQQVGIQAFAALAGGDLLFIDSSHILMPGSDVDFLFNRVLPGLPVGALVHIHDITLPDDYPRAWAWRGYNEQLAVAPLLLGGAWNILFASHFVATRHAARVAQSPVGGLPQWPGAQPTSLWLEKLR